MPAPAAAFFAGNPAEHASRTRSGDVYERLRADILRCHLVPGARLRFDELRVAYATGLSPLREALMKLAAQGLVTLEEHKGFRVARVSEAELTDLTMMRREIEALAVRLSIERSDDEWEATLVARFHSLGKRSFLNAGGEMDDEWEARHHAFHAALFAACGSPWLMHVRGLLWEQFARYRRLWARYEASSRDLVDEHREMMEAAVKRDVAGAVYLIQRHVTRTTETLLGNHRTFFQNDDAEETEIAAAE